jgi:hypothetical protein
MPIDAMYSQSLALRPCVNGWHEKCLTLEAGERLSSCVPNGEMPIFDPRSFTWFSESVLGFDMA